MTAARIFIKNGFMRTKLRSLFSDYVDDIDIIDYRENKDKLSTNIWIECKEDNIEWFLTKFKEVYDSIYNDDGLIIKIFKGGNYLIGGYDSI
jgi:hypothetical protein